MAIVRLYDMTRHTSLFLCLAALSAVPVRPARAQQSPDVVNPRFQ